MYSISWSPVKHCHCDCDEVTLIDVDVCDAIYSANLIGSESFLNSGVLQHVTSLLNNWFNQPRGHSQH